LRPLLVRSRKRSQTQSRKSNGTASSPGRVTLRIRPSSSTSRGSLRQSAGKPLVGKGSLRRLAERWRGGRSRRRPLGLAAWPACSGAGDEIRKMTSPSPIRQFVLARGFAQTFRYRSTVAQTTTLARKP
jgi:hypothetical protein